MTASVCELSGQDGVVPVAVKRGGLKIKGGHLGIGHLDAFRVGAAVEAALDGEAGAGGGAGDQLDDHPVGQQRLAAPVLGDEGEQPMLDPVPLAGARPQVGHRDRQPGLVRAALQLALPQPDPHAVAAAAVGGDQQPGGGGIAGPAKVPPPVPNALDGEGGSVVIDAEIDPSGIRGDVVDAGGRHLAQLGEGEIVHPNRFGLALGAQLAAAVLEVSDEFFLLCVDRDRWLAGGLPSLTWPFVNSNWASRSGWLVPSRVLLLACRLKPSRRSSRPTSFWPAAKPRSVSARARWRWLLLTHSKAASGSPRMADCTSSLRASSRPGCVSTAGLRPPPGRRTRLPRSSRPRRSSARPRPMVLRATRVAVATAVTPPRPAARASLAVNRRRPRSSRNGAIASKRVRMPEISITPAA